MPRHFGIKAAPIVVNTRPLTARERRAAKLAAVRARLEQWRDVFLNRRIR